MEPEALATTTENSLKLDSASSPFLSSQDFRVGKSDAWRSAERTQHKTEPDLIIYTFI